MEVLHEPPKSDTFIPLSDHQSATPASFYSGPPVLHYYSDRSKVLILEDEIEKAPAFSQLFNRVTASISTESTTSQTNGDDGAANGHTDTSLGPRRVLDDVDVWVTSDKLYLFSATANAGLSIPYPSISLHAIQSLPEPSSADQQGLYMQLISSTNDTNSDEDEDLDSVSVTIIPTASAPPTATASEPTADDEDPIANEDKPEVTPVEALFTALSNCSNLHPDPVDPDEQDADMSGIGGSRLFQAGLIMPGARDGEGLPPAMPGSGGWITSENMHEFVDENGNWIGDDGADDGSEVEDRMDDGDDAEGTSLGPGAGTVRTREDDSATRDTAADGGGSEETKWRRIT